MKFTATTVSRAKAASILLAGGIVALGALTAAASDRVYPSTQVFGITLCSKTSACVEGDNASTGPGLEGISAKGNGVIGQTTFNSTSASNGQAAVLGQDESASGTHDAGLMGTSIRGTGIVATSKSGNAVNATSSSGTAVNATSSSGTAVNAKSSSGTAVTATSLSGFGLIVSASDVAVSADSSSNTAIDASGYLAGISGLSSGGIGVTGNGITDAGVWAIGGGSAPDGGLAAALEVNADASGDLIYACAVTGPNPCEAGGGRPVAQFAAINNGNVFITGQIFTSGSCSGGCLPTRVSGERRVRLYTPQESLPTIEDFGEAQLVGGQTYVRIDPAFANTIDKTAPYMVVITPEGDSNGLYVTNKTAVGFEVRENRGGRSTLGFSYRIVARPFGEHAERLRLITVTRPGMSLPESRFQ